MLLNLISYEHGSHKPGIPEKSGVSEIKKELKNLEIWLKLLKSLEKIKYLTNLHV